MRISITGCLVTLFVCLFWTSATAKEPVGPCCAITEIDMRTSIVTARDVKTQRKLQFKAPARLLRSLKTGQQVQVDYRAKTVSVAGVRTPFAIINVRPAEPVGEPNATAQAMSSGDGGMQQYSSGATMQAITAFPLGAFEEGREMMRKAASQLRLDIDFEFLNKSYKNDVYVREPITNKKVRVSCVRFRATSGFRLKMDPPTYSLTNQGLTVTQNFPKIKADGLTYRFQLGPCADIAGGFGVQLSDVKFVYKARPIISFEEDGCSVSWNADPNGIAISIGDLNIIGVQNDLDKLAKDAVREAINFTLDAAVGSGLRGELQKVAVQTCGNPKDVVRFH